MKIPPLQSLRAFECVARTGSVRRASEELCVSPSSVSHQVNKLEQWLGTPLIERSGRGIRLTSAGERYKVEVCGAFSRIHAQTELLRKHRDSPVVRVACLPGVAVSWLMPQIHDFWMKHPDVQLAIHYSRLEDHLEPDAVDVGVRYGQPSQYPDFVAVPFLDGAVCPFASPDLLQRVGYKDLSDIARLPLVHDAGGRTWRKWLLRAAASGYDFDPRLADAGPIYSDGHLVQGACLAGEGAAMFSRELVQLQLRAKVLVPLSDLSVAGDSSYLLLTPKGRQLTRNALLFAQWIQSLPGTLSRGSN